MTCHDFDVNTLFVETLLDKGLLSLDSHLLRGDRSLHSARCHLCEGHGVGLSIPRKFFVFVRSFLPFYDIPQTPYNVTVIFM